MPSVLPPRERVAPALDAALRTGDLRDLFAGPEAVWRIHTALVHRVYGVALGFESRVYLGGRVVVGPGLAYDAAGRALTSPTNVLVPAPPAGSPWELRASAGAGRACPDRIALRWVAPGSRGDRGDAPGIPVVRYVRGGGSPDLIDARVWTRRIARPQVASGTVTGTATLAGLHHHELPVPAVSAGFATTPLYLACVREASAAGSQGGVPAARGPFVEIRDAAPQGFVAGLRWLGWDLPSGAPPKAVAVTLDWVGIVAAERPAVPLAQGPMVDLRGCPVAARRTPDWTPEEDVS